MKIGEGIVRFCPVTYFYKEYQQQNNNLENQDEENHYTAMNPS
jgi:hypothetical protein